MKVRPTNSSVVHLRRGIRRAVFKTRRAGRSSGLKKIAMDSLNHLKTSYRPRFFNREGKKNATDIQGESVLECAHNCFETCTKQFIECSSTVSCDSSFNWNQVPCHSKEKEQTKLEFAKDNTFVSLRSPDKMGKFSGSKVSEEIKENDIEVLCLGSPDLLVESGEEGEGEGGEKSCAEQLCFNEEGFYLSQKFSKSKGFSAGKEMEELCIEEPASKQIKMSGPMLSLNSATLKPEEECEFLIEECFDLSSASWISISRKKQKPQKKMSASFEGNQEAKQHNERRKNKRGLEKTVMPIPLQEINTTLCNVGERSFDGFQNASRIKQVMAVENNKSQLVRSFVTSQETRKQMHSKNKYKDSAEIHNRSYPISRKQAKGLIPLLEADQKLSVQIQPLEITKESLSRNKLTRLTKVQYEKQQECIALALSSKHCTQFKNTDISSDNSDSISSFIPVAQQSCHNTPVKKPQLPSKKQSGSQKKKKRSPAGPLGKKNRQLVSEGSLEDVHGEEHLEKKKNLHPFKLKRATPQKIRETSLPKPQNNVLYQEDSCEQHVAKKHSNISVTSQNNEGSLSRDPLLLSLRNNEMFRREWNPFNTDDSDSDKSADLEKNLFSPESNSLKHKIIVLPTNTPNVRRSKRIRIKPLEYWRGERVDYKINSSGDFVIGGIISPEQRESRKPKAQVDMKSVSEIENLHDNSIFMEHFFQPAVVFDKASNQQILLECVHNGSSPVFCFSNEILSIYKYLSTPSFASGKIILNPLKEKGYQYSHTDTLVFHVSCGKLLLKLYDRSYCLTAGNYFFIPPGNVYNIRNLLNEECVILFTQLKGKELLDN